MRSLAGMFIVMIVAIGCVANPESPSTVSPTALVTTATSGSSTPTILTTSSTVAEALSIPTISTIDAESAGRVTSTWREGCPAPLEDLRLLRLGYHDFSGEAHVGEMVVHRDVAEDVVMVFETLFDSGFPIEQMELVDVYGGDDEASMRANNTSAFNCRKIEGTDRWSEHAFGRAVDVNPLLNPWVRGSTVFPAEGSVYVDRSLQVQGMIHPDYLVVSAFESIGWTWGGRWSASKDYQHFSSTGR